MSSLSTFFRSATAAGSYASLLAGALLVLFLATGCDSDDDEDSTTPPTIADRAEDTSNLSTLNAALEATDLDEALDDEAATFTVFAPTNAAFESYEVEYLLDNPDLLGSVLEYHVVEGAALNAADLSDGDTFTTLQGDTLEVSVEGSNVFVEGAQVTTTDVEASNGVVHLIDDVLLSNRNAVERATVTSAFSTLEELVGQAGLAEVLAGPGPDGEDGLTVFAPTNDAFLATLDANDNGAIDDDEVPENAADILSYHVLDDVFFAADVPEAETVLPTLEGAEVTVVRDGEAVTVNPAAEAASVVVPNAEVSNGVIHGIDAVLTPPE